MKDDINMRSILVRVTDASKHYEAAGELVAALSDVSLEIATGDFVAIVGPSGSGKSTLLALLGGMTPPTAGDVVIDDQRIYLLPPEKLADFRREYIGFVFQQQHLISYLNVIENVMLPLAVGKPGKGQRERALAALEEVGMAHRARHLADQLSGGERGRVAIARAIVNDPALILADEPTGNLDGDTGSTVLHLLTALNERGRTVVMVTHNPEAALAARRIVTLRNGRIAP